MLDPADVSPEILRRAQSVRLLIMDVDGVLTDGRVLYIGRQMQGAAFNVQDGTGIKYLHRAGIRTALISGRDSEEAIARAATLDIEHVVVGAKVKVDAYERVIGQVGVGDAEVAYVGDDLPDIPVMRRVVLAFSVPGAAPEVVEHAHVVTARHGGAGAVREIAEFILRAQGKWRTILSRYVD